MSDTTGALERPEQEEQLYCYGHPDTPTKLRCSRCDRPICGRCAIPATVGQHCPECVAEARRTAPKVRTVLAATAPAVRAIIGICVAIYLLQFFGIAGVTERFVEDPFLIDAGETYRLFTAMFLHGSPLHLILNMYVLYLYGPTVEQAYGTSRFVVMYLLAGLGGSVASYVLPPDAPSLGASGAIFGVAGILVAYLFRRRKQTVMNDYLRGMMGFLALNIALGFLLRGRIDWIAHLGGLVTGFVLGWGFDAGRGTEARASTATQVTTTVIVVVVMGAALMTRDGLV